MRLLSPDDACYGAKMYNGNHYNSRIVDTNDSGEVRALKAVGYTVAGVAAQPVRRGGYRCSECDFSSFFRLCSRCGGVCERPDLIA
jgi:hypothetical protein